MRNYLVLFFAVFTFTLTAQSGVHDGIYEVKHEASNGDFHEYRITLNPDGTFLFHSHSEIAMGIPPENDTYGKGTWRAEKNTIIFSTEKLKDLNETHSLDFSETKARYDTKSPRDKSDRIIRTKLKFYESDIFWVKGKKLFKTE